MDSTVDQQTTQRSPNQPNQSQNQSVIDQDNLITRKMCFLLQVKRHEIDEKKFSRRTLFFRSIRTSLLICLKTSELGKFTINQGILMSNSSNAHTVKEQHAPEAHCEVTLLNTDNEFYREIKKEDIDLNIPGPPHSTVKQLHDVSVRELIHKIENHPHRYAFQRDLQQSQSFNPFSPESKQMIHEVGNIELCELLDMEPKAQCKVCPSH